MNPEFEPTTSGTPRTSTVPSVLIIYLGFGIRVTVREGRRSREKSSRTTREFDRYIRSEISTRKRRKENLLELSQGALLQRNVIWYPTLSRNLRTSVSADWIIISIKGHNCALYHDGDLKVTRKELTGDERPNYRNASRGPSDNDIKRMLEKDKEGKIFKLASRILTIFMSEKTILDLTGRSLQYSKTRIIRFRPHTNLFWRRWWPK